MAGPGRKLRKAAIAVVTAAATGIPDAQLYDAQSDRSKEKVFPCVIFFSQDGREVVKATGNYAIPLFVSVQAAADADPAVPGDDPEANQGRFEEAVLDALRDENTAADMTAAIDRFYVYEVHDQGPAEVEVEGGGFLTGHIFEIVCAEENLS